MPAPRSSTTIPVPSGSLSKLRTGGGLTISNARKSIKPASRACHVMGHAISVTSCPATSSITTCDGSFLPHPRASSVAAGMPIATASAISSTITGIRAEGGRCAANSHHNNTVASEPHVPGPGRNRPAPKNVATRVAHRGAGGPHRPRVTLPSCFVGSRSWNRLSPDRSMGWRSHRPRSPTCRDQSRGSVRCRKDTQDLCPVRSFDRLDTVSCEPVS